MKYLAWVLAVVALIYIWADYRFVTDAVTNGLSYFFGRLDADSLKDRPLEPFALPSGHCKASFPGSPHTALPGRELLSTFSYPGTCCAMSDREVTYYLSELAMPNRFPEFTAVAKPQLVITTIRAGASSLPVTNEPVLNTTADQTDEVKAQKAIDQIVNDWAKANTASFASRIPVAIGGGRFNGREITGYMKDPTKGFRLRFFADYPGKRIVAIGIIGKLERVKSPSSSIFIQSLEMWQ